MPGHVVSIHVADAANAPTKAVEAVRALPGRGLEGDRYFLRTGTYSGQEGADRELTLIEVEAIEALRRDYGVSLESGETRRNVVTRGVALNHLVGRVFRVGSTTARGIRLCEPCSHMEKLAGKRIRPGLVHRGGLRAEILMEGWIRVGDEVEASDTGETRD